MKDRVSHPQHVVLTQPFDPAFELPASCAKSMRYKCQLYRQIATKKRRKLHLTDK
jgi:hypothetical protein